MIPNATPGVFATQTTPANMLLWKTATAVLAFLWLLTLFMYFRRGPRPTEDFADNEAGLQDEKALLKSFQKACQKGDATSAREALAKWIRHYAPAGYRGSMRQFGARCGETSLMNLIAELDASGFAEEGAGGWSGAALWNAFSHWQKGFGETRKTRIGKEPDLYTR